MKDSLSINHCTLCGKLIREARDGSMTSWIFGASSCSCKLRTTLASVDRVEIDSEPLPAAGALPEVSQRYRLDDLLASGGMGLVYKATDMHLDKLCVVKLMRPETVGSQAALQRFGHETRACASFRHRNLVPVTDYNVAENGTPYLVMDYVEGVSLSEIIKDKQNELSQEEAVSVFRQVVSAVQYAHDAGLIHRDIKPDNILISRESSGEIVVRLLDFGIARSESHGGEIQRLTQTGEVLGSPLYMSPEQCSGLQVDERSDIYSIGCIMYEVLTGRPPFRGNSLLEIMNQHLSVAPVSPGEIRPGIRPSIEAIVVKCLKKDPDGRYESASQLLAALTDVSRPRSLAVGPVAFVVALTVLILLVVPASIGLMQLQNNQSMQSGEKEGRIVEEDGLSAGWLINLQTSRILLQKKLPKSSTRLLTDGLKQGVRADAPPDALISFLAQYLSTVSNTWPWPDPEVRLNNYTRARALFDIVRPAVGKLGDMPHSKRTEAAGDFLAMSYFYLSELALNAGQYRDHKNFLKLAYENCSDNFEFSWLKLRTLVSWGSKELEGEDAYECLKKAYDVCERLMEEEPETIENSLWPHRLYRALAEICNETGRFEEAEKFASIGLNYKNKATLPKGHNAELRKELEIARRKAK